MSKGFACDTDEMRALIARHEELRSDLERVVVPPKGAAWGFSVVREPRGEIECLVGPYRSQVAYLFEPA